ncbi:5-(carboxyamino)imidazole ribonucleotide synthase [Rothia sp. P7181]|uniref:5-(carboxyamino)imidazole ribonucleotide synthase n=1 Tax=unclassified Rothia (in: high G+C Gram-positive bacteria) TaxID=2689056 RepID=UPI003AD39AB0
MVVNSPIIGIVGGGQLARMMAAPAHELGLHLKVMAEDKNSCARQTIPEAPVGDYTDYTQLHDFAQNVDVLTFDHEHVPTDFLERLISEGINVQPRPQALIYAQDKLQMRQAVHRLGLANPPWAEVRTREELFSFGEKYGWDIVLKTPRGGYDGKGVMVISSPEQAHGKDVARWFAQLEHNTAFSSLLVEEKVPFTRELSALVARNDNGEIRLWDISESRQVNSVCDEVIAPAPALSEHLAQKIRDTAQTLARELNVTGVMAVELFEVPDSPEGFYINELAMRPHNTGHWTQNGSKTSQFEQHLRAVLNLPLGDTQLTEPSALMKNILGGTHENIWELYPQALAFEPQAKIHLYGKDVRPGRKIGHINITGSEQSLPQRQLAAETLSRLFSTGAETLTSSKE